jgi:hypothetical protein
MRKKYLPMKTIKLLAAEWQVEFCDFSGWEWWNFVKNNS